MRALKVLLFGIVFVLLAICVLWGTLALWFRAPGPEWLRLLLAGAFALLGVATLKALFTPLRWRWLAVFGVVFLAHLTWWNSLVPTSGEPYAPEVARQVTGTIEGDLLTLENMRDFEWRSEEDITERWITGTYDLSQLESVDLFMSYWGGPAMAHLMISFGFSDGEYLNWSVEVRRSRGGVFSPVADFFKANMVSVVAGTERDIVGLRSNAQAAEVYLYRLKSSPERRRAFLESYVTYANDLVEQPRFFHSLFSNCSKTVIDLARAVGSPLPIDWRVLVNGYFPEYLYDQGAMAEGYSFEELRDLGYISGRARAFGLREGYAEAIREGVPVP